MLTKEVALAGMVGSLSSLNFFDNFVAICTRFKRLMYVITQTDQKNPQLRTNISQTLKNHILMGGTVKMAIVILVVLVIYGQLKGVAPTIFK
jgi:hypothetical protein